MSENFFDKAERELNERAVAGDRRKHDLFMEMLAVLHDARMVLTQGHGVRATAPIIKTIDAVIAKAKGR